MTNKPCPHKLLKKQMSGMQVWYVCECGQKFKAQEWDGRVKVVRVGINATGANAEDQVNEG